MGQRANLVIVKQDGYDLYYNHWCANTLPCELFWGPEHAISFIQAQKKVEQTDWLDDIWAEGGAVIDEAKKLLLFYGGEEEQSNIPFRRLFLEVMQKVWGEWEINWAHEGIVDLAEYVGVPRERVISGNDDDLAYINLRPPSAMNWIDTIASIKFEDEETLIFPLDGGIEGYLLHGPELLQNCNKSFGYKQFHMEEWGSDFPTSGFHIDTKNKQIEIWYADGFSNIVQRLQKKWPDWKVLDHCDRYETQSEILKDRLQFQTRHRSEMLSEMKALLLRSPKNPLDIISSLVTRLQKDGKEVNVNPRAYMHGNYCVPEATREEIIRFAFS
ncbi:hypothetical protein [Paenibacillus aceris]|uniref:Uncharacterized protein n=1 Tax=Paenibacillus aceris TaxID=869555 RepID=A0ABS4HWD8_9BACL|nr:hypothetical protein [Paenibacillus aceris]MBP1962957.1 hypothetical protein [Paenibacillus aceris]NHW38383.1 hypothetical protein [Paenibacillus aceris]